MKKIFFLLLIIPALAFGQRTFEFAGLKIKADADAEKSISEIVAQQKNNAWSYKTMLKRSQLWLPLADTVFRLMHVPEDLKYLALVESSLRGDAVSSSNAVGFWQFKDFTARDMGLRVDELIDERKHFVWATVAAAKYFYRVNKDFDNWVYALIAYNQGPDGALKYTSPDLFGAKQLNADKNLHRYPMKAIAYKEAYHDAMSLGKLQKSPLMPYRVQGETSLPKLADALGVDPDTIRTYNLWILKDSLPAGSWLILVPEQQVKLTPAVYTEIKQKPAVYQQVYTKELKTPDSDPLHGTEFVFTTKEEQVPAISAKYGIRMKKLLKWNDLALTEKVRKGRIIFLIPAKKATYHIAEAGESLEDIAALHRKSVKKLMKLNPGLKNGGPKPGERVWLRDDRPANEKVIYVLSDEKPKGEEQVLLTDADEGNGNSGGEIPAAGGGSSWPEVDPLPPFTTRWVNYKVKSGESLWSISKQFEMRVPVIKLINKLDGNVIQPGQVLKLMEKIYQ